MLQNAGGHANNGVVVSKVVSKVKLVSVSLPRDASAEHGIATVSRLSVRPSVTFRYHDHIGWNSSKIISRPNSLRPMCSLTPHLGDLVQREHPQN